MTGSAGAFTAILAGSWLLFAAAVYLPDVGRGFVKDDFGWVDAGRAALDAPAAALLPSAPGFYRPAVAFTFAFDYLLHDVRPRGYGFTNLALYLLCIGAISRLAREAGLSAPAATLAAVLWAVNPHGINMAVVWLSGRTSLCVTLFAVLSAIAVTKRRYVWTAVLVGAALASKEEAIALPAMLFAWHRLVARHAAAGADVRRAGWRLAAAVAVPTAVYLSIRAQTAAFMPWSAPSYYRFSFAPLFLLRNALEYADRAATIGVIAIALAAVAYRLAPGVDRSRVRLLAACAVWSIGAYGLTAFLPIRSSLYAVFPSVGAAIGAAVIIENMTMRAASRHVASQRADELRLAVVLGAVLLAMVPVYRARNARYVEPARLSERALRTIDAHAAAATQGVIVLHDADDPMSSFVGAFGTFARDAVRLHSGRDINVWIDPPPGEWRLAGLRPPRPREPQLTFAVEHGRVYKVGPSR